jgi:lipoprotein-anchoring transpeptidase ErfK/SrfK
MRSAIFLALMLMTSATAFAIGVVNTSKDIGYTPDGDHPEVVHAVGTDEPLPISRAVSRDEDFTKFLQQVEYEQQKMNTETVAHPEPDVKFSNVKWYTDNFEVVVKINKGTQQEWIIRHNGNQLVTDGPYDISTGVEEWTCDRVIDKTKKSDGGRWRMVWTGTPTGCFPIHHCDIDHRSGEYNEARMQHACFLEMNGVLTGMALHQGAEPDRLGNRASHGCIRESDVLSKWTYDTILPTQGKIDVDSPFNKAQCPPWEAVRPEVCAGRAESVKANFEFKQEIEGVAASLQGKKDSNGEALPYDSTPSTPQVSWDCKRSAAKTRKGPSAIVLIECIDKNGKTCAKNGHADTNEPRQQPKIYPSESIQGICQAAAIRAANKIKDPKERAAHMPPPLIEPYASEAARCYPDANCMAGIPAGTPAGSAGPAPAQPQTYNSFWDLFNPNRR